MNIRSRLQKIEALVGPLPDPYHLKLAVLFDQAEAGDASAQRELQNTFAAWARQQLRGHDDLHAAVLSKLGDAPDEIVEIYEVAHETVGIGLRLLAAGKSPDALEQTAGAVQEALHHVTEYIRGQEALTALRPYWYAVRRAKDLFPELKEAFPATDFEGFLENIKALSTLAKGV